MFDFLARNTLDLIGVWVFCFMAEFLNQITNLCDACLVKPETGQLILHLLDVFNTATARGLKE